MSAFRPLLRVFIEGSVLLRHNIAGNLATLEVVSGVPSGAGPATDPSQYYSFELTILSTVISASVTDVTDPEVMKEGAFAFSITGISLAHSTVAIQDSVVAAEKKSGSSAAVALAFRDIHLGFGARVLLYNTTISVTVTNGDSGGGRGLRLLESSLSNGASVSIAKSNITVKVSSTSSANAMAFAFESGPFTGQTTQISFIDTVIEVTAITGAGYGLRVANATIAGGASLDVHKCGCTIKAVGSAVLFIRETSALVTGSGTRLSFVDVNASVASSASAAFGFHCKASETAAGAAIAVIGSTISVTSTLEAAAWNFDFGSR